MKKFTLLISAVVASTLLLTGCVGNEEPVPTPEPTETFNEETPVVEGEAPTAEGQRAIAAEMWPDVEAIGDYSKEDVQLSLYTAYMYGTAAFEDPYWVSGAFAESDFDTATFELSMRRYFSANGWVRFHEALELVHLEDQAARSEGINWLIRNVFLVSLRGSDFVAPEGCTEYAAPCFDEPVNFSNWNYYTDANGNLIVSYKVTGSATFKTPQGQSHTVQREYNVKMLMTQNEEALVDEDFLFVIDGIDNSVKGT